MARSRNIKPSFFKNEHMAELNPYCQLLFIGLLTLADAKGFLEDRPKRIKAEIFPFIELDIENLLNELENSEGEFIVRHKLEKSNYIEIINFVKHQNPHFKEKAPVYECFEEQHYASLKKTGLAQNKNCQFPLLPITESPLLKDDSFLLNTEIEKKIEPPEEKKINTLKPITDDWRPSEKTLAMIPINWPNKLKNIEDEIFKFKTYYQAENKLKADWDKQFQLWLSNSKVFESRGPTGIKKTDRLARIGTEEEFEKLAELQKQGVDVWKMPQ